MRERAIVKMSLELFFDELGPFFATFAAQYIRVQITYNDDLMNVPETHENEYIQNAMVIWTRQAGKVIF